MVSVLRIHARGFFEYDVFDSYITKLLTKQTACAFLKNKKDEKNGLKLTVAVAVWLFRCLVCWIAVYIGFKIKISSLNTLDWT